MPGDVGIAACLLPVAGDSSSSPSSLQGPCGGGVVAYVPHNLLALGSCAGGIAGDGLMPGDACWSRTCLIRRISSHSEALGSKQTNPYQGKQRRTHKRTTTTRVSRDAMTRMLLGRIVSILQREVCSTNSREVWRRRQRTTMTTTTTTTREGCLQSTRRRRTITNA
ncbi:hypothetical protein NFJ02_12g09830 [Pycnococcus provasolii]